MNPKPLLISLKALKRPKPGGPSGLYKAPSGTVEIASPGSKRAQTVQVLTANGQITCWWPRRPLEMQQGFRMGVCHAWVRGPILSKQKLRGSEAVNRMPCQYSGHPNYNEHRRTPAPQPPPWPYGANRMTSSCGSSCLRSDAACLSQASLCAPAAPSIHTWHTPTIPLFS